MPPFYRPGDPRPLYRCSRCGLEGTHDEMWRHSFHVHRHGDDLSNDRDVPTFEGVEYTDADPEAGLHL